MSGDDVLGVEGFDPGPTWTHRVQPRRLVHASNGAMTGCRVMLPHAQHEPLPDGPDRVRLVTCRECRVMLSDDQSAWYRLLGLQFASAATAAVESDQKYWGARHALRTLHAPASLGPVVAALWLDLLPPLWDGGTPRVDAPSHPTPKTVHFCHD